MKSDLFYESPKLNGNETQKGKQIQRRYTVVAAASRLLSR